MRVRVRKGRCILALCVLICNQLPLLFDVKILVTVQLMIKLHQCHCSAFGERGARRTRTVFIWWGNPNSHRGLAHDNSVQWKVSHFCFTLVCSDCTGYFDTRVGHQVGDATSRHAIHRCYIRDLVGISGEWRRRRFITFLRHPLNKGWKRKGDEICGNHKKQ